MAEIGERGRKAQKRNRTPLAEHELSDLHTPQDAARRLDFVGQAVGMGRLTHAQGRTIAMATREWLRAHEAGRMADRVETLREQVEALKTTR